MEGSRSCLGLVRGIWMSWASRCYQGLIAKVTSWMPMSLHWESHPSDVFQRLWLKIFSAQRLILPQKRLSAIFINPGHNLRLLSPVTIYWCWFSAQICPQAVILAYKNISSSPQKRSKKTSEHTLETLWKSNEQGLNVMAEMFLVYPMHFTITNAQHSHARSLTALLKAADPHGKVDIIRANYHYENFL